jgi:hypothetical protein
VAPPVSTFPAIWRFTRLYGIPCTVPKVARLHPATPAVVDQMATFINGRTNGGLFQELT